MAEYMLTFNGIRIPGAEGVFSYCAGYRDGLVSQGSRGRFEIVPWVPAVGGENR